MLKLSLVIGVGLATAAGISLAQAQALYFTGHGITERGRCELEIQVANIGVAPLEALSLRIGAALRFGEEVLYFRASELRRDARRRQQFWLPRPCEELTSLRVLRVTSCYDGRTHYTDCAAHIGGFVIVGDRHIPLTVAAP